MERSGIEDNRQTSLTLRSSGALLRLRPLSLGVRPQVLSEIADLVVQKSTNPFPTLLLSPNYGYLSRDDRRERSRRTEAGIYRNPRIEAEFDGS